MSTQLSTPVTRGSSEALSLIKREPEWLAALRAEAAERAEGLEWPKPEKMRIERWALGALGEYKAAEPVSRTEDLPAVIQPYLPQQTGGDYLVQHNSSIVFRQLSEELKAQGVIFTDLETAAREHADLVRPYLHTAVRQDEDKLNALHAALWNGGVFLYVPKNVDVELPVQALFLTDDPEATFAPHILIVAETNSRVTYVDRVISAGRAGKPSIHHGAAEVIVKAGAKVRFATIHQLDADVIDLSIRRATVERDGGIEWIIGDLNDGSVLSDTTSSLDGDGSTSDAKIISIGAADQKMSLTTRAVHFGKSTDSNMVTRAVMKDQATAIINGITKIEKGATKANGVQAEKVLMLSPKARGDANPILLIDEDDVTAGHAASVGQVSPEQIHYLMSRGISRVEAERLIIYGFLAPVVSEIPVEAVRTQLRELLERKLQS
ncbi:Fe-S cluster assembly protein SufD [Paenibacillus sp. 598K]|uniref:Fe-S cluster assembly protein SufD n=1 Tax=Paenibacillus sp. 598K TaxID=1117987 RepID=UPI000FF94984|nr:Fe-S cluster assembly protein SufD [Paenibacillus sp. 598K]GBF73112.1 Fe-S cluster assembly protein SufD [Paenibacillus sp. 598K]